MESSSRTRVKMLLWVEKIGGSKLSFTRADLFFHEIKSIYYSINEQIFNIRELGALVAVISHPGLFQGDANKT